MSTEKNQNLVRRFFEEVVNEGNLALVDRIFDPQYQSQDSGILPASAISLDSPIPAIPPGPEGVKQTVELYRNTFPDLRVVVNDISAKGDVVETTVVGSGTAFKTAGDAASSEENVRQSARVTFIFRAGMITSSRTRFD